MDEEKTLTPEERMQQLAVLVAQGLTLADCIRAFATPEENLYVKTGRTLVLGADDLEIDNVTTVSEGTGGAWVLSWLWVSNEEAGMLGHSDLLQEVLEHACVALEDADPATPNLALREAQSGWLEETLVNFWDEIDDIGSTKVTQLPGAITWRCAEAQFSFMASDALWQLLALAKTAGLPDNRAEEAARFVARYGNTLDAALASIPLPEEFGIGRPI